MAEPVVGMLREKPVLDPARSLGWRTGPLDGLSCMLRCVEAVLRAQGFDPLAVARALAQPLDLAGGRKQLTAFRSGNLSWHSEDDGARHWDRITAAVSGGTPVILMPDRFYWPDDEFGGQRHFFDHMVLVTDVTAGEISVLDINAPADDGYVCVIPVTPNVVRSACRYATAHFTYRPDTAQTIGTELLLPLAEWLADDLPSLIEFGQRWEQDGLTGPFARALHVLILGEAQPNLFLTAHAVDEHYPAAAAALFAAAEDARRLGLKLLDAHRWAGEDADDTTVYGPVLSFQHTLCDRLSDVDAELRRALDTPVVTGQADDRIWRRLDRLRSWLFGESVSL